MSLKAFFIIGGLILTGILGSVIGYNSKINVPTLASQVDMTAAQTKLSWYFNNKSYCVGDCRNVKTTTTSTSWGGGSFGGGGFGGGGGGGK